MKLPSSFFFFCHQVAKFLYHCKEMETTDTRPRAPDHGRKNITIWVPIGELVGANFNLENAVCSHGLFMMAPNKWDPHSKTLERPLRLSSHGDYNSPSIIVQISHPQDTPNALRVRVFDVEFLSDHHQQSLQVISQLYIIVFISAFTCSCRKICPNNI